jgi:hypothetical protein
MNHKFPTTVIDNFYENPDEIRKMALEMEYDVTEWTYPGKRTQPLQNINKNLFEYSCNKLMSVFFDLDNPCKWVIKTQFQQIEPYGDKGSVVDKGWIHLDEGVFLAAVVYLTPNADPDAGTSIYQLKPTESEEVNQDIRKSLYDPTVNFNDCSEEYVKTFEEHQNQFVETVRVSNIYNRAIIFDANSYHGVPSYHTGTESRLTQTFFVYELEAPIPPLQRVNNVKFNC